MKLKNIQAIARKEFYHIIRDFRSLYLAFAIPLILILLFGYALSLDVNNVTTVVVDYDKTDLSRDFIRHIDASPYFQVTPLDDTRDATEYLDHGRAMLALIIPPGWTKNLRADRDAPLQVLIDGSDPNFGSTTAGYITGLVEQYNRRLLSAFLNRRGMDQIQPPVEARIRVWFNEDLESTNFIIPGIIAVIIMIVGAMLTSLVIAREYETGTMETIRSIPVGAGEFFIGKALPYFFIGMTDVMVAVLMGQVLFGVIVKSNFWLLVLAASIYLAVALSLGLMISVLTKSLLIANVAAVLTTFLPSMLLSDFVFPVSNMPEVLRLITYIVPARHFINILNGLYLRNLGFAYLWQSYLILTVMFLILATVTFRLLKREGL
ncbi:MAG: ABC transporter permease [Deltaproteobacteria bacterium]|nr:ABC transporter permease [Deltaproteobacteria bacterium]